MESPIGMPVPTMEMLDFKAVYQKAFGHIVRSSSRSSVKLRSLDFIYASSYVLTDRYWVFCIPIILIIF